MPGQIANAVGRDIQDIRLDARIKHEARYQVANHGLYILGDRTNHHAHTYHCSCFGTSARPLSRTDRSRQGRLINRSHIGSDERRCTMDEKRAKYLP